MSFSTVSKSLLCAALVAASACASHPPAASQAPDAQAPDAQAPASPAPAAPQATAPQGTGTAQATASEGKPTAPATISAQISGTTAHVTVRFGQGARDVVIRAEGARGLSVQTPQLASGSTVAEGQVLTFDVPFQPGPGESLLAISVHGTFAAGVRSTVRAFPVGTAPATPQRSQDAGSTVAGQPVEMVPAQSN